MFDFPLPFSLRCISLSLSFWIPERKQFLRNAPEAEKVAFFQGIQCESAAAFVIHEKLSIAFSVYRAKGGGGNGISNGSPAGSTGIRSVGSVYADEATFDDQF